MPMKKVIYFITLHGRRERPACCTRLISLQSAWLEQKLEWDIRKRTCVTKSMILCGCKRKDSWWSSCLMCSAVGFLMQLYLWTTWYQTYYIYSVEVLCWLCTLCGGGKTGISYSLVFCDALPWYLQYVCSWSTHCSIAINMVQIIGS